MHGGEGKTHLREDGDQERREDRRVDTGGEVSKLSDKHGREDLVESKVGELLVQEVEGDGESETGEDHVGDESVLGAGCVQRLSEGTCELSDKVSEILAVRRGRKKDAPHAIAPLL